MCVCLLRSDAAWLRCYYSVRLGLGKGREAFLCSHIIMYTHTYIYIYVCVKRDMWGFESTASMCPPAFVLSIICILCLHPPACLPFDLSDVMFINLFVRFWRDAPAQFLGVSPSFAKHRETPRSSASSSPELNRCSRSFAGLRETPRSFV